MAMFVAYFMVVVVLVVVVVEVEGVLQLHFAFALAWWTSLCYVLCLRTIVRVS